MARLLNRYKTSTQILTTSSLILIAGYSIYNSSLKKPKLNLETFVPVPILQKQLTNNILNLKVDLINKDFNLPEDEKDEVSVLHFHVKDSSMQVMRSYTPIFKDNLIEFLVKVYKQGQVSNFLNGLKDGDFLELRGPYRTFIHSTTKFNKVNLIAGGTGIIPFYQLLNKILAEHKVTDTQYNLVYFSGDRKSILLKEEIDKLQEKFQGRLKVYYVLDNKDAGMSGNEKYLEGPVNSNLLQTVLGGRTKEKCIIYVSGPDRFLELVGGTNLNNFKFSLLNRLGYLKNEVTVLQNQ